MRTETICILTTLVISNAVLPAAALGNSPADAVPAHQSISWDGIGAAAGKQCQGGALAVLATDDGALLHCAFQRMDGYATDVGLWLATTTTNSHVEHFRLVATDWRRTSECPGVALPASSAHEKLSDRFSVGSGEQNEMSLCLTQKVRVVGSVVRWERPGLTEEYSVSMDGVRQDFVIERRPPGEGNLRLELALFGAQVEAATYGAKLIVEGSRREIAYGRLGVADATGKELPAQIEVDSDCRLAMRVDDEGAAYPLRIDPTFSDANWVSLGGLPGANGTVFAMVANTNAGLLYIGGSFTIVGTVVAPALQNGTGAPGCVWDRDWEVP
jgi:hypothetical protein